MRSVIMLGVNRVVSGLADNLLSHFPTRTKRMMLLVSLSNRISVFGSAHEPLDHQTLTQLNKVMGLASDVKATELPNLLSRVILRGKTVYQVQCTVNDVDAQCIVTEVKKDIPKWLNYEDMDKDIKMLLNNIPMILNPSVA